MDPDEGLLDHILGRGHVTDQQYGQAEQLLVVPDIKRREVVKILLVRRLDHHRQARPRVGGVGRFWLIRRMPGHKGCSVLSLA